MSPSTISELLRKAVHVEEGSDLEPETVTTQGWVRTSRFAKRVTFIHLYDGSSARTLQIVVSPAVSPELRARLGVGAAIQVTGPLVPSKGPEQPSEIKTTEDQITVIGDCDASAFPVQKKEASPEFWRTIPHLRVRTAEFQRVFQARHHLSQAVHRFFSDRGYHWVHTPIITFSDCEGAGEMFHVATRGESGHESGHDGPIPLSDDTFFGHPASLTVSGQLEVETFCMSLGKVYTFGPTFRAENSHTSRHASEFWMIEPELAFASLADVMDLAQEFVQELSHAAEKHLRKPLGLGFQWGDQFPRITYTEAQEILAASGKTFEHPIGWGESLQAEHERYLSEEHFGKPVFVTHCPIEQKPFYMRVTDGCEPGRQTVECFDLLVPGVGEIIGGSAREERLDKLLWQMERCEIDMAEYDWYIDLRRYGSVPHGGFGLGFERALMWLTGVENIRDVLPFPRTPS